MNLLETILQAGGGNVVGQLAQRFGLDAQTAQAAVASLVPALAAGVQRNASSPGGLEALIGALQGGDHQRYLDDPSTLARPETVEDGNGILGHLLGSKDVSRQVAQQASARTGVGADVLKKMLPLVAGLVMAQLSKRAASAGPAPGQPSSGGVNAGDLLGSLSGLVDADHDGKVEASDLLDMAKKIF